MPVPTTGGGGPAATTPNTSFTWGSDFALWGTQYAVWE